MDNSSSQKSKSPLKQKVLDSHSDLLSKYANDIILLTDNDWQILKVNDKALSVYQYDISEIVGMLVTKLEKIDERNEEVELDFSFKNGFLYEAVHIKKDGTTFPVEISLRTMRVEGVRYKQLIVTCPLKTVPVIKLENNLNWAHKEVTHAKKTLQTRRNHQAFAIS